MDTPEPTRTMEVPYLIVGAGPVGLTAALLLADLGQTCLVVERRDGPLRHPAAHVVNARTLEVFRQAGLDMARVLAVAQDPADAGHVNFVTSLGGEVIGRLPFERQGDECLADTPTPLRNISQHHLEPILADIVTASRTAVLRYEVEWRSSEQDERGVTSTLHDLASGEVLEVRSRYVLAADGAGSPIRKSLDIAMVGPPTLQSFIATHFAADLRALVADNPGVLHFVLDPEANGTFVAHDVDREWVFMSSFDPTEESVDDYDDARAEAIVRAAMTTTGGDDVDIEILSVGSWHMSAQVATAMRSERIFLIGDAAHRFPPTGGLGLNTGVGDAHNLAWKLAAVEAGWAPETLLDTYQIERQPVATINCEQSTSNAFKMVSLIEALGLTVSPTTEQMLTTLADRSNRAKIDAAVADQTTHFDMIGLQLGYVYTDGALARRGDQPEPMSDPRRFDPDAAVGTRLPHGWTGDGRSTLDLIRQDRLTLLTAGDHERWQAGLDEIEGPVAQVPIAHIPIDDEVDPDGNWRARCRLEPTGALLVRGDQHIAWRGDTATGDGPDTLTEAVDRVLDR